MQIIKESLPAYLSDVKKTINFQYEQYKSQESYYLNDDIRSTVDLPSLLTSKYPQETVEGLRFLLGLLLREGDLNPFAPQIIMNISRQDYEIKALGYYIFTEYVSRNRDSEIVILCISTFLKDFMSIKNFIRTLSLKAICTVYKKGIDEFVDDMIIKGSKDKSIVVRRTSTVGIYKISMSDGFTEHKKEMYLKILENSMKDFVLNSGLAVIVYFKVSGGESLAFLHPHFRKICQNLKYYPELEAASVMNVLHRYAVRYLIYAEGNIT
jgi:vesicle coat complex subunit